MHYNSTIFCILLEVERTTMMKALCRTIATEHTHKQVPRQLKQEDGCTQVCVHTYTRTHTERRMLGDKVSHSCSDFSTVSLTIGKSKGMCLLTCMVRRHDACWENY